LGAVANVLIELNEGSFIQEFVDSFPSGLFPLGIVVSRWEISSLAVTASW